MQRVCSGIWGPRIEGPDQGRMVLNLDYGGTVGLYS